MVNRDADRVGEAPGTSEDPNDQPVTVHAVTRGVRLIVPVILSGGVGTRLWPLSRANMPKQVLPLWGGEPMILAAAKRMAGVGSAPPIVVCGDEQQFLVSDALCRNGVQLSSLLLEPQGKNTAAAIAVAALRASALHPEAVLVVQPSDHIVTDVAAFESTVRRACQLAERDDKLVLLGVRPT